MRCEKQSTFGALESDFWQLLDNFLICSKVHVTQRMFPQFRCLATFLPFQVCKLKRFYWVPVEWWCWPNTSPGRSPDLLQGQAQSHSPVAYPALNCKVTEKPPFPAANLSVPDTPQTVQTEYFFFYLCIVPRVFHCPGTLLPHQQEERDFP